MNKKNLLFASTFALMLLSSSFVSAYYFPSARFVGQDLVYTVTDFFEPILTALFGNYAAGYTFEVLLLFLIISSIVYFVIGKAELFGGSKSVKWILTIAVPLLSVRFIDYEWLVTIFDQYKLLGIVLTSIIPFILYFYFLYHAAGNHGFIRKAGWGLFVAVYIGLWSGAYVNEFNSAVYFWTFIVGMCCLLGDNLIRKRFQLMEEVSKDRKFINIEVTRINKQIAELTDALRTGTAHDVKETRNMIASLEKDKKWIMTK